MNPRRRILPVFIPHLGCPQNCVFCSQRQISGSLRAPTAREVTAQLETALERLPQDAAFEIAFYGGSFTAIPPEDQIAYLSAAAAFHHRAGGGVIRLSTRPDCIDDAVLDRLSHYPVTTVELGAQSMDDSVLMLSGRGHTAEDTVRASRVVRARGFELVLQMMTGLPGDTEEKSLETARRLAALRPDGVRIYPTVILRDTPLYRMWKEGSYREHTVEEAVRWCAPILAYFESAGIPVIRLGLNPSDGLSAGQAAGGAYHPAFGELVRSRLYLEKARALLRGTAPGSDVVLGVAKGQLSAMLGQRRRNIEQLIRDFSLHSLRVRETQLASGQLIILQEEKDRETCF